MFCMYVDHAEADDELQRRVTKENNHLGSICSKSRASAGNLRQAWLYVGLKALSRHHGRAILANDETILEHLRAILGQLRPS